MTGSTPSVRLTESTRVESFSDAVIAIVITILVLELRVPPHAPGRLMAALVDMWPAVAAFLLSFLRVAVIWMNHHGLFVHIRRVDRTLIWLNLGLLLNSMIIPLPTMVLADALRGGNSADLRVATVMYVSLAALQSAAWIPIFSYLGNHPGLADPGTDAAVFHAQRVRPWVGADIDVAAAIVALVSPVAALVLWTLSLIFLAATSDGVGASFLMRRRRVPAPTAAASR